MIYLTKHIFLRDWQISLETLGCNWWSEMRKLFSSIGKEDWLRFTPINKIKPYVMGITGFLRPKFIALMNPSTDMKRN